LNQQGLTIVLVTHEPDIAAYAKRRVVFRDGHIIRDEPIDIPRSARDEWRALVNAGPDTSKVQVKEETQ
jgi:putative ABC transport system ATP-binding protein